MAGSSTSRGRWRGWGAEAADSKEHRSLLTPALALCGRGGKDLHGAARVGEDSARWGGLRAQGGLLLGVATAGYENRHEECSGVRWFCERKKKVREEDKAPKLRLSFPISLQLNRLK